MAHDARYLNAGTVSTGTVSAGGVREALDREGCAFGQVTRERVDNVLAHLQGVEALVQAIAIGVALQLLAFLFAVVLFVLNHVH